MLLAAGSVSSMNAAAVISAYYEEFTQIGAASTESTGYKLTHELDGFDSVTHATVQAGSGTVLTYNPLDSDGYTEQETEYNSKSEMLADAPLGTTFTHTIDGDIVSITAPTANTYEQYMPSAPIVTITGVTGTWQKDENGLGTFYFDPADVVGSFTITVGGMSGAEGGVKYNSYALVGLLDGGYQELGDLTEGILDTPPGPLDLTFTKGAAADAGDSDESTYGFTAGDVFEIETAHTNVALLDTVGEDEKLQLFVSETTFNVVAGPAPTAVPEPSTSLLLLGSSLFIFGRRRR